MEITLETYSPKKQGVRLNIYTYLECVCGGGGVHENVCCRKMRNSGRITTQNSLLKISMNPE